MKPKAKIVLDTRKKLVTGMYQVKIRVGFKSDKIRYQYYALSDQISMFPKEFEKIDRHPRFDDIKAELAKAEDIIRNNPHITPETFSFLFVGKGNYQSLQGILTILKDQAESKGNIGTADTYKTTCGSITEFAKQKFNTDGTIVLGQITPEFLSEFETWHLEVRKNSYNTVGIHTRNIRTSMNYAIDKGLIKPNQYAFGRNKYVCPAEVTKKRPLNIEQKNTFISAVFTDAKMRESHSYCLLSYYCFGMNFSDIARLKWNQVGDSIQKYRSKTSRTKRQQMKLEIPITPEIRAIIQEYGIRSLNPHAYVFPILSEGMTPRQEKERIKAFIKKTNKNLKIISAELGLPVIRTYTMRYTFAYIMKKFNVNIERVQGMMGHENARTTKAYQGSIEVDETSEAAKFLYVIGQ